MESKRGAASFRWLSRFFFPRHAFFGPQYAPRKLVLPDTPPAREDASLPRISVVVPSLNQADFLGRTLSSLEGQHYPNLEILVVDGGSEDGSRDGIRAQEKKLAWWCSEPDQGQANAVNKGFVHSSGEILAWLNSDDMLAPGALFRVGSFFLDNPATDVVYSHRILVDEHDREVGRWILPPHNGNILPWADYVPQETLFWRRSMWDMAGGGLDESFSFAMDWDLLLRFRAAGAVMKRLPCFLGLFRLHPGQKTQAAMAEIGEGEMARLRKRELGHVPSRARMAVRLAPYLIRSRVHELLYRAGVLGYR